MMGGRHPGPPLDVALVADLLKHGLWRRAVDATGQQVHHGPTEKPRLVRAARQIDQGWRQVHMAHWYRRVSRQQAGHVHDKGNLGVGRIQVVAVGVDAVLAQRLAVIAGDDNHRLVPQAQCLQLVEHAAEVMVGEPDLAIVEVGLALAEGRRLGVTLVVEVRVIEVQPEKELLLPVLAQERDALVGHLACRGSNRLRGTTDVDVQGLRIRHRRNRCRARSHAGQRA